MAYRPDGGTVLLQGEAGSPLGRAEVGAEPFLSSLTSALVPAGTGWLELNLSPGHHLISGFRLWRMVSIQILA